MITPLKNELKLALVNIFHSNGSELSYNFLTFPIILGMKIGPLQSGMVVPEKYLAELIRITCFNLSRKL